MSTNPYHIADLISKYLSGTLTVQEEEVLEQWVAANGENRAAFEAIQSDTQARIDMGFFARLDMEQAWEKISRRPVKEAGTGRALRPLGIAAAAVIFLAAVGVGWWWYGTTPKTDTPEVATANVTGNDVMPGSQQAVLKLSDGRTIDLAAGANAVKERDGTTITTTAGELTYVNRQQPDETASTELLYNELRVPKAGMYNLTLSDGTSVWLNAMSELRFPTRFGNTERKVFLEGEAYFEVAPDASRPFKVEANGTVVEVLGTHFNINSYNAVTTTVVEGSVKVIHAEKSELLKPGQQARVTGGIVVEPADMRKAIAWKNGDFYFRSDGIVDIMEQLARWYDLSIVFAGDIPYHKGYNGNISRDVNLSEVLVILGFATRATFKIEERKVTVQF